MTGNTQRAFIAANDFFTKATLPFGAGVIAETTEQAAQTRSIRQPSLRTKRQWYHILIPATEYFFHLHLSLQEQPYPVLHSLLSQKSLSALFYDEFTRFKWQLAAFVKDKTEEEKARITGLESVSFFHKKRELLLALPLGDSFVSLLTDRTANNCGDVITSFFNYLGIAGIQFTDSGETRFLIFNAGKSVTITAIRREKKIYRQGENLE